MLDNIKSITIGQMAKEGGRWLAILFVVFGYFWQWGKPHAEEFITDTVSDEIRILKEAIDQLQAADRATGTQLTIQGEQLNSIKELSSQQQSLSIEILRALGER